MRYVADEQSIWGKVVWSEEELAYTVVYIEYGNTHGKNAREMPMIPKPIACTRPGSPVRRSTSSRH